MISINIERLFYFAYGSNMATERLKLRIPSAEFICIAELPNRVLNFHKPSKKDGSGKCDATLTGNNNNRVLGAVFSILKSELALLDKFEGQGYGYDRQTITVINKNLESIEVQTYFATKLDSTLRPFDWYKEHVVRGAKSINLPLDYIAAIEAVACEVDMDVERRAKELAVYGY